MTFSEFNSDQQTASISAFVEEVLEKYPIEAKSIECINFEFNATFKILTKTNEQFALRVNINSKRTKANLAAEVDFVQFLQRSSDINLPSPQSMRDGAYFGSAFHKDSGRFLNFVLYSWLAGQEIGHAPKLEHAFALGVLMAKMHEATQGFVLSGDASLSQLRDPLWGQTNHLYGPQSSLSDENQDSFRSVLHHIDVVLAEIYKSGTPQPIHADLHGGNVLEDGGELSVLDFDDCAIGYPLQDIATTLYYFDTQEQDRAFLDGYASIKLLPNYTQDQMDLLLLQRRLVLLNYLLETTTPEHRAMAPEYLEQTLLRITKRAN